MKTKTDKVIEEWNEFVKSFPHGIGKDDVSSFDAFKEGYNRAIKKLEQEQNKKIKRIWKERDDLQELFHKAEDKIEELKTKLKEKDDAVEKVFEDLIKNYSKLPSNESADYITALNKFKSELNKQKTKTEDE